MALEKIQKHPEYKHSEKAIKALLKELDGLLGFPEFLIDGQEKKSHAVLFLEFLDGFETNITCPAQVARLLLLLKDVHALNVHEDYVTPEVIVSKAGDGLTSSDHIIYISPLSFLRQNWNAFKKLLDEFGICAFIGISEIAAMDDKTFEAFFQNLILRVFPRKNVEACLQENKEPNSNLNELRKHFNLPIILPKDICYPGANPSEVLTPDNFYTLQESDIYLGMQLLQENPVFNGAWDFERGGIQYCLIPTVFSVTFRKNEPDINEQFISMGKTFCSLLNNKSFKEGVRILIAGILLVDNNHYINYFLSTNNIGIDIFLLDPSAEKEVGKKKSKEFFYLSIFNYLIVDQFKGFQINQYPCNVSQQLQERDCGFLCLQNLEDVFTKEGVFSIENRVGLKFNGSLLTVNGNAGKGTDQNDNCYYAAKLNLDTRAVREAWAKRFKAKKEVHYFHLNPEPTLVKLVADYSFKQDPYNYDENVERQYNQDFLEKLRGSLYAAICGLKISNNQSFIDNWVSSFQKDLTIIKGHTISGTADAIKKDALGLANRKFENGLDISGVEKELKKSLGELMREFFVDALNMECQQIFATHFVAFVKSYEWPVDAQNFECIFNDFLEQKKLKKYFKLPGAKTKAEVLDHLQRECTKEIKDTILTECGILARVNAEISLDILRQWALNTDLLYNEVKNRNLVVSILSPKQLKLDLLARINTIVNELIESTCEEFARGKSLAELQQMGVENFCKAVLAANKLSFVLKISKKEVIERKIGAFIGRHLEKLKEDENKSSCVLC